MDKLDQSLGHSGQEAMRSLVRALPEEEVSLRWRSELNERIRREAGTAPARRSFALWAWKPAVALALAGSFAVVALLRSPEISGGTFVNQTPIEATLVSIHNQNSLYSDLTAAGLNGSEAMYDASGFNPGLPWAPDDLDSL
jgi:hypothetical protein